MSDVVYYAIGDVHGEIEKLDRLLDLVREDARRIGGAYKIVFFGDLIDRGPQSRAAVTRAFAATRSGEAVTLMGNHEQMLLNAYDSSERNVYATWSLNGGDSALISYEAAMGKRGDWRESIDREHVKFFRALPSLFVDDARAKSYQIESD
jgi:serine/threonine protein phosphatase 1